VCIDGDGTYGTHERLATGLGLPLQQQLELVSSPLGGEVAVRHGFEALLEREFLGARTGQHDVLRALHHEAGQLDGTAHVTHARDWHPPAGRGRP